MRYNRLYHERVLQVNLVVCSGLPFHAPISQNLITTDEGNMTTDFLSDLLNRISSTNTIVSGEASFQLVLLLEFNRMTHPNGKSFYKKYLPSNVSIDLSNEQYRIISEFIFDSF